MKKFISILLTLVLTVGLLVPVGAQASDPPCYVMTTIGSDNATVVKGDSTNLVFFVPDYFPSNDLAHTLFVIEIYKGDIDSFLEDEDPELVESREYTCDKFTADKEIAITWKADSRYAVGDYSMICCMVSDDGYFYEQSICVSELHVVKSACPATDIELAIFDLDNDYEFISMFPDQITYQQTYTLGAFLMPEVNTSSKSYKITNYDASCLGVAQTGFHGLVQIKGKKVGTFEFTVDFGSVKKTYHFDCVMDGLRIEMAPEKGAVCPGQTDNLNVEYFQDIGSYSTAISADHVVPVWSSSNNLVATVDNGVITAHNPGTVTITVKAGNASKRITYTVLPHDMPDDAILAHPTATQPGSAKGTCARCGKENLEVILDPVFTDTNPASWYSQPLDYIYEHGIMNGVKEHTFGPSNPMNRAMVVTVLYRAAGSPEVEGEIPFSDVPTNSYYSKAVLWASQNGIVNGYADGTYLPERNITREQLATILYRYAAMQGIALKEGADLSIFPDEGKVSSYARNAMGWAVETGLFTGIKSADGTNLVPKGNATRAQVATILYRYMTTEW